MLLGIAAIDDTNAGVIHLSTAAVQVGMELLDFDQHGVDHFRRVLSGKLKEVTPPCLGVARGAFQVGKLVEQKLGRERLAWSDADPSVESAALVRVSRSILEFRLGDAPVSMEPGDDLVSPEHPRQQEHATHSSALGALEVANFGRDGSHFAAFPRSLRLFARLRGSGLGLRLGRLPLPKARVVIVDVVGVGVAVGEAGLLELD